DAVADDGLEAGELELDGVSPWDERWKPVDADCVGHPCHRAGHEYRTADGYRGARRRGALLVGGLHQDAASLHLSVRRRCDARERKHSQEPERVLHAIPPQNSVVSRYRKEF